MDENENTEMLSSYQDILVFDELVEILNVGRNTTYELLRNKEIYSKKLAKNIKYQKYV